MINPLGTGEGYFMGLAVLFFIASLIGPKEGAGTSKEVSFYTKLTKGAFKNLNIDFIGKRKIFYVLSSILIIYGGYSLSTKGLNYGIDFVGGRTYIVSFEGEVNKDDVKNGLTSVFNGQSPSVSSFNLKWSVWSNCF